LRIALEHLSKMQVFDWLAVLIISRTKKSFWGLSIFYF
jgi:hypothetical protein